MAYDQLTADLLRVSDGLRNRIAELEQQHAQKDERIAELEEQVAESDQKLVEFESWLNPREVDMPTDPDVIFEMKLSPFDDEPNQVHAIKKTGNVMYQSYGIVGMEKLYKYRYYEIMMWRPLTPLSDRETPT